MPSLQSKFTGCLVGQSLADALGAPVEGQPGAVCRTYAVQSLRPWFDGGTPDETIFSGQYTDDSQMARELLASLVKCEGWQPEDYSKRIQHLFRKNIIVGRGLACDAAVDRLIAGVSWDKAGEPTGVAGNGTAMRAAPVGLVFHSDLDRLQTVAHLQGYLTHHDTRCSAGSIAIAGGVALLLRDEFTSAEAYITRLAEWMQPYSDEFAVGMRQLLPWVSLPPEEAVEIIALQGRSPDHTEFWPGISPFVIPSVLWSFYAFLRHPDSYSEAVIESIICGGDVDTTAAMTGALSGARLGLEALPSHLTKSIHDHGAWKLPHLVSLAEQAHSLFAA